MACSSDVDCRVMETTSRIALNFGLPVRNELRRIARVQLPSIIYSHGLWHPVNYWAACFARQHGLPFIVQTHGMLAPWALNHKAWKKRIAFWLYQQRDISSANVIVATSELEYENIRQIGFRGPIALIPNGVVLIDPSIFNRQAATKRDKRTVLFLSRIHPVKGLINLVKAWNYLSPVQWRLCIAGPNEAGHLDEVMALVRQMGICDSVEYIGVVDGKEKTALYLSADVFVLPSFTENFGIVVAESLAHGLPVITTRGTPWADLETYGCGWWVDVGVEPLIRALRQAIALTDHERAEMGERGREYVQHYDWCKSAQKLSDVYRWVLRQGLMPDCVRLD